ncbi:MAG: arylsulfatase [Acidimicrobiia bacterium]
MSEVVEYQPGEAFPGVIGRTLDESSPAWPAPTRARDGAPNVIFFVWDDVGYGQMSVFGGLCETPNVDRLADRGLRYSNFHTTALCSPTRGSLLTGRNHHTLGLSAITELSIGYPAHNGYMGFEHGFLSEILLEHGYNTFAVGKWHLAPPEETTTAGPFHRWPLGRGFERYYGFLGGDTDQWFPDLTYDNHPVPVPATPEDGYHLNIDMADKSIQFIKDAHVNAPEKPFFLYYATGAGHAPHHVEPEWIEKYKGRFDAGWDEYRKTVFDRQKELGLLPAEAELSAADPDVPPWDSLSEEAQRVYAHQMEVYAAFVEQTDHHFGRIIDYVDDLGELDNTIVVVISDNGASAEGGIHGTFNEALFFNQVEETLEDNLNHIDDWGGLDTFPHYSWGWAWAGDTPFRRWKRETYRGGVTDPCVIFWPDGIESSGEVRSQYSHVVDVAPTILDALGIEAPTAIRGVSQSPIQGVSFAHSFDDGAADSKRTSQYFEMFGQRSMYYEGWKANCPLPGPSFVEAAEKGRYFGMPLTGELLDDLDAHDWELYNVIDDPAETKNLAEERPEKLREMVRRWYAEAGRYGVFPISSAELSRMNVPRPAVAKPRQRFVYQRDSAPVAFAAAPKLYNRPYSITAEVVIPEAGAEGILITQGSRHAGYALFIKDGRLHHIHNYVGLDRFTVTSPDPVPTGEVTVRYEFEPTGPPDFAVGRGSPGLSQLYVNGGLVASLELPYSTPNMFGVLGLSCGYAAFDTVDTRAYAAPFRFTGEIKQVVIDVTGELIKDDEAELNRLMAQQ